MGLGGGGGASAQLRAAIFILKCVPVPTMPLPELNCTPNLTLLNRTCTSPGACLCPRVEAEAARDQREKTGVQREHLEQGEHQGCDLVGQEERGGSSDASWGGEERGGGRSSSDATWWGKGEGGDCGLEQTPAL
jgi:hypothetical protein